MRRELQLRMYALATSVPWYHRDFVNQASDPIMGLVLMVLVTTLRDKGLIAHIISVRHLRMDAQIRSRGRGAGKGHVPTVVGALQVGSCGHSSVLVGFLPEGR